MTAFYYAAINRDELMIKLLLEKGKGFEVPNYGPGTLWWSTEEVVKTILDKGPNLVLRATHSLSQELLNRRYDFLCGRGTLETDPRGRGWSALLWAVWNKNRAMVRLLLEKGANVNYRSPNVGWTALHIETWRGNEKMVRFLLEKGANPNVQEKLTFYYPIHLAVRGNYISIVKLLLEKGASINSGTISPLQLAIGRLVCGVPLIQYLVEQGSDVNLKDLHGFSPLVNALCRKNSVIIELLLESGADVNARSPGHTSLLHRAAQFGTEDIIRLLVQYGADTHLLHHGRRPVDLLHIRVHHDDGGAGRMRITQLLQ